MFQLNKLISILCMQQGANINEHHQMRTSLSYILYAICILAGFESILYDVKQQLVIFTLSNLNL